VDIEAAIDVGLVPRLAIESLAFGLVPRDTASSISRLLDHPYLRPKESTCE
jgi:hypothetical protein